jgi:hypothetical protein
VLLFRAKTNPGLASSPLFFDPAARYATENAPSLLIKPQMTKRRSRVISGLVRCSKVDDFNEEGEKGERSHRQKSLMLIHFTSGPVVAAPQPTTY